MMKTFVSVLIVVCLATAVDMAPVKTNLAIEERAPFSSTTAATSTSSPEPPAPAMFYARPT